MKRFQIREEAKPHRKGLILSLLLFPAILLVFLFGIHNLSAGSYARQRQNLERALARIVTCCYAVEGRYPQDLAYMEEHYGLTYDQDRFFVDYTVQGSNLYPDITIIERTD